MDTLLITPRLHLRPWRDTDLTAMATINADERVMEYFPSTQSEEETMGFINRNQVHQEKHGYCYFAAETRNDNRLIGFIGLAYQTYEADFTPCTDIGWRLHPDVWGQGLATEGARACLDFAFGELELDQVVAVAVKQNTPSIRVMEKLGMDYGSEFIHPALVEHPSISRCVLYTVKT
ncbi:MAG: GNAT family N-acetyltransferase [Bacteroidota bacterium]